MIDENELMKNEKYRTVNDEKGRKLYEYKYQHPDGEVFTVTKPTLIRCRIARDRWIREKNEVN